MRVWSIQTSTAEVVKRARVGLAQAGVLYLYPDDIEAYHRLVRDNGLTVPDLEVTFYGMTEFGIEDPDGNRLWIGQKR